MTEWTPRFECIYGRCKMVNLCKGSHCVGANLSRQGYKVDGFGNIVEKEKDDCAAESTSPLIK